MPRLQQDNFTVFVSHKSADKELANLVANELVNLAPRQIECWVSGQALTAGIDWDREIKKQLAESHLLVLLFTTPEHNWDWCLYEVGLFVRFDADEVISVACLFDPSGSPPAPLNQVQCVRAASKEIAEQLVRPLCTQTWNLSDTWQRGALVPDVSDEVVDATAKRIADGFHSTLANSDSSRSADARPLPAVPSHRARPRTLRTARHARRIPRALASSKAPTTPRVTPCRCSGLTSAWRGGAGETSSTRSTVASRPWLT